MTHAFQISKKLNDGSILVVGGETAAEFATNLQAIIGDEGRDAVRAAFYDIIPASAGATLPAAAPSPAQAEAIVQRAFPDAQPVPQGNVVQGSFGQSQAQPDGQPGEAPLCPNHGQPARWVAPGVSKSTGKSYQGFWSCNVSERGDRSCRVGR